MHLKFSIIIAFKDININLINCLKSISNLNYKNFETILIPDHSINLKEFNNLNIKIIPSGNIMPGLKRDLGSKHSAGDILAFLDDDAQPNNNWLNEAVDYFKEHNELALGGPGIDNFNHDKNLVQILSDIFFKSKFFGVPDRYKIGEKEKYYDDWPSVNLMIKKNVFEKINGFNTDHWPGEDTVLCSKLKSENIKILYVPKLFVYHVRRVNILKLTKQIFNYGFKRGIFFFEYPNNSRNIKFFIPTIFIIYLFSFSIYHNFIFFIPLFLYVIIAIFNYLIYSKNILGLLIFPFFCIYNHIIYGISYTLGFLKFFFLR